jgi:RNA polymerase sigma factor (sigma-70 family)
LHGQGVAKDQGDLVCSGHRANANMTAAAKKRKVRRAQRGERLPAARSLSYYLNVKAIPGTLQAGGASFATTHWSVVAACQNGGEDEVAIAQLCRDYWPPLYSFVRRRGYSQADAQDLVQGFFTHLLRNRIYAQSKSEKGKFRTFLLAAMKNYMVDLWSKERALKRGGDQSFVLLEAEIAAVEQLYGSESPAATLDEEWHYEQRWATALVSRALAGLRETFRGEAKAEVFEKLQPLICGGTRLPRQEDLAQQLKMPIDTLRSHLSRMRARYRALLREEVARTIGTADDVDEELRRLSQILIEAL